MSITYPIDTHDDPSIAYQLNWSLSLFNRVEIPSAVDWLEALKIATEADGVRILELNEKPRVLQLWLSTQPFVAPANALRSVKGRLQYIIRDQCPRAFRRNYRIESVGSANATTLDDYVASQVERHPMADSRIQERFHCLQFHDPSVDLTTIRYSAHGQFLHNLQVVFENVNGWHEVRDKVLRQMQERLIQSCRKHTYALSRIGMVSNHLHLNVGCDVNDPPLEVGLELLRDLSSTLETQKALKDSFYLGTFGNYDRNAMRKHLK